MKSYFTLAATVILAIFMFQFGQAHDEGHGPKLNDAGKYGGLISAMVLASEANLEDRAKIVHKAELVRSSDGTTRIYLYDLKMKPLDLSDFGTTAKAMTITHARDKRAPSQFKLERKGNIFVGKVPKPGSKPYNLEFIVKQSGKELLAAFENLD